MKKIMFFIAIIVCFVTSVNAQVLSNEEWKEVAKHARVIHSYKEINENDSVLDLHYLDHGIMCCPTCIGHMKLSVDINEIFQQLYDKVDSGNAAQCHKLLCKSISLMTRNHKAWFEHLNGGKCRRGRSDAAMYMMIAQELLVYGDNKQDLAYRMIMVYL